MRLVLTSLDVDLAEAWRRHCGELEFVELHRGSILAVDCDAIVSPANSFGFMDGGIDLIYSRHFGWELQNRLQQAIRENHYGELPVGQSEIVETGDAAIPYLIAAPTMRVPSVLRETVNPYLAARAALLHVCYGTAPAGEATRPAHEVVQSIAFPGLGTGVGQVDPDVCARQFRAAVDDVLIRERPFPESWTAAQERHHRLLEG